MQSFQGSRSWIWQGWCQDDAGAQRLIPEVEHAAFLDILADAKKNTMQANVMKAEGLLARDLASQDEAGTYHVARPVGPDCWWPNSCFGHLSPAKLSLWLTRARAARAGARARAWGFTDPVVIGAARAVAADLLVADFEATVAAQESPHCHRS